MVALFAFAFYVALAGSVHNLYPFSTFAMFAGGHAARASRIVARDGAGRVHEVDGFARWRCDGPLRVEHDACAQHGAYSQVDYQDRAALDFLGAHAGDGGEPVDLVRRIWRLDGGAPAIEDCLVAHCRAANVAEPR